MPSLAGFKPPVRKLIDILLVRMLSAELFLDELKRLLFTTCTWDLKKDLGVSCKQPDLVLCVLHWRCSTLFPVLLTKPRRARTYRMQRGMV